MTEQQGETPALGGKPPLASSPRVRRVMLGNRNRDTKPELALRRELHRRGLRFWVHRRLPPAKTYADIVFPKQRVAVFVDGCFWHGCPHHYRPSRKNAAYWSTKIARNVARDRANEAQLQRAGWVVMRVWEHDSVDVAAKRVADQVWRLKDAESCG